jgi:hypothetical protein
VLVNTVRKLKKKKLFGEKCCPWERQMTRPLFKNHLDQSHDWKNGKKKIFEFVMFVFNHLIVILISFTKHFFFY